ncbi:MAG: helix-turn-helix transcriptional regulator [Opitutales bacterium]
MSSARIERFLAPQNLHEAIPGLGRSQQSAARQGLMPHRHSCTEVCLVSDGHLDYFTEASFYSLGPRSVQINQPGQLHGTAKGILGRCTLSWIQLEVAALLPREQAREARELPFRMETGASRLQPFLDVILREHREPRSDSPLVVEAQARLLLVELLRLAREVAPPPQRPPVLIAALQAIESQQPFFPRVGDLAEQLGVHRTHLHQLFKLHLGISPQSYLNERRLRRACTLLDSTALSITEIGHQLEFASSQHFASAFRKWSGRTPGAFRRDLKDSL